jgi:hypothetical protein
MGCPNVSGNESGCAECFNATLNIRVNREPKALNVRGDTVLVDELEMDANENSVVGRVDQLADDAQRLVRFLFIGFVGNNRDCEFGFFELLSGFFKLIPRNKKPPACAGGSCSCGRVQLTG